MTNPPGAMPPLPANLPHVVRRIRACESEVPAQVVFEHALQAYAAPLIARVAELERQNEAQKDEWFSWESKRSALEKDAERYRWLLENSEVVFNETQHFLTRSGKWIYSQHPTRHELDAAIDAAIAAKD